MSALNETVAQWVREHPLPPPHVDCATAVMLKILDRKCKMKPDEKIVMTALYQAVKQHPGDKLGDDMHQMIASAVEPLDEATRMRVYETRVLAETMISRPVMKQFKAGLRSDGLFEAAAQTDELLELDQSA